MLKVVVTGHTSGIGKSIYEYFSNGNEVLGFSRSNGYDISLEHDRYRIAEQSISADVFVNNAYNNYDDSQKMMLELILEKWKNTDKMIINLSSRYTSKDTTYCKSKADLDIFCKQHAYDSVYILNLQPGLTDTPRVINSKSKIKMHTNDVVTVIDFAIKNRKLFRVHAICFGL